MGDKAPPAARDSSKVARTQTQRCYPHIGNDRHSWCLRSSLSLSVGRSRGCWSVCATGGSLPWGCYLLAPLTGNKERSMGLVVLWLRPTPTRLLYLICSSFFILTLETKALNSSLSWSTGLPVQDETMDIAPLPPLICLLP